MGIQRKSSKESRELLESVRGRIGVREVVGQWAGSCLLKGFRAGNSQQPCIMRPGTHTAACII